jgi:glutaredoxin
MIARLVGAADVLRRREAGRSRRRRVRLVRALAFLVLLASLVALGCKRAPAPLASDAPAEAVVTVRDESDGLLLTWIDERGDFHVEQRVTDVPLVGRDVVRVVDPSRSEGAHGERIIVADLRTSRPDGTYAVQWSTRAEFERSALARRAKFLGAEGHAGGSGSTEGEGPYAPERAHPGDGHARPAVIIYGASWCEACHQAASYLTQRGVPFVEKDVEESSAAAREMQQKLATAGLRGGSIPVLDVRGLILIGFNAQRLDDALGKAL